jgi:phenylpropionate dioxygenase-like ring-hydroxylating dioxygenase large terminal subunit
MSDLDIALWRKHWHLICHRSEVADPWDFVRLEVAGTEVVVFNDGASVVAFDNRCPHRGTRIYQGTCGNHRFVCPYHGWSFAKGRVFVAGREKFQHLDLSALDLNRLNIEWLDDFLFVSWEPATSLENQLGGVLPAVRQVSRNIARRFDVNAYVYECDWRIALENALEPYHIGMIHPETLGRLRLDAGRNDYFGRNSIWSAEVSDKSLEKRLRTLSKRFNIEGAFEGYSSIHIFPYTMISSTFGLSYSVQHFLPSACPERTDFLSRLFVSRLAKSGNPAILSSFFESTVALNRATFEEDHQICKLVPLDSWSDQPPLYWSEVEEKVVHFRKSMAAFRQGLS